MPAFSRYAIGNQLTPISEVNQPPAITGTGKTLVPLVWQYNARFPLYQADLYNEDKTPGVDTVLYSVLQNHKTIAGSSGPYEFVAQWWDRYQSHSTGSTLATTDTDFYLHWQQNESYMDLTEYDSSIALNTVLWRPTGFVGITDSTGDNFDQIPNESDDINDVYGISRVATTGSSYSSFRRLAMGNHGSVYTGMATYRTFWNADDNRLPVAEMQNDGSTPHVYKGFRLLAAI